ncbi:MAG: hypothetical protein CMJ58_02005 [Planctomycetaceae bacterium]|nr:hypothetical protein [Planctomycetaceae bacterium]
MTDSSSSDRLPDAPSAPRGGEAFPQGNVAHRLLHESKTLSPVAAAVQRSLARTAELSECVAARALEWPVVDGIGRFDDGALKLLDAHCRLAKSMASAARLLIRDNH